MSDRPGSISKIFGTRRLKGIPDIRTSSGPTSNRSSSSGYGKDLSMYGLEDYTRIKHVMHYHGFER